MIHAWILKKHSQLVYALAASQLDSRADVEAVYEAVFVRYAQTLPFLLTKSRAVEWFAKTTITTANQRRRENAARGQSAENSSLTAPADRPSKALTKRTLAAMPSPLRIRGAQCAVYAKAHARALRRIIATMMMMLSAFVMTSDVLALKPFAHGCTAKIVEARVCHDMLYLAIDEDYNGIADIVSSANAVYNESLDESMHRIEYLGRLTAPDGRTLTFSDEQMYRDACDEIDDYHTVKYFKVYIPGLAEACGDSAQKWECSVDVSSVDVIPCAESPHRDKRAAVTTLRAEMPFTPPVSQGRAYHFDFSYAFEDMEIAFRTLYVGGEETHLVGEMIPRGQVASLCAGDWVINYLWLNYFITASNGWGIEPEYMTDVHLFSCDSRYYFCTAIPTGNVESLTEVAEHGRFALESLGYYADVRRFADDGEYSRDFRDEISVNPIYDSHSSELYFFYTTNRYTDVITQTMPTQTVAVGQRYGTETDSDGNTCDLYGLSHTFRAGSLTFQTVSLRSDQTISIDNVLIDGEPTLSSNPPWRDDLNFLELNDIVLLAQKDGRTIGKYYTAGFSERVLNGIWDDDETEKIPDTIILGYAVYSIYDDEKTHRTTQYIYYDPDYCTENGTSLDDVKAEKKAYKQAEREAAMFAEHNTFTTVESDFEGETDHD